MSTNEVSQDVPAVPEAAPPVAPVVAAPVEVAPPVVVQAAPAVKAEPKKKSPPVGVEVGTRAVTSKDGLVPMSDKEQTPDPFGLRKA